MLTSILPDLPKCYTRTMNSTSDILDAQPQAPNLGVSFEALRGAPFDIEAEANKVREWQQNGGAMSPNHVARMLVDPQIIDRIAKACDFGFSNVTDHIQATNEDDVTLDPETVAIIQQIQNQFESYIKLDFESGGATIDKLYSFVNLGLFQNDEYEKHLDEQSADLALRYGIVLAGSPTGWITGISSPLDFDESAECIEGSPTGELPVDQFEVGVVEQFASDSYPHTLPVTNGEFRMTIFATIWPAQLS